MCLEVSKSDTWRILENIIVWNFVAPINLLFRIRLLLRATFFTTTTTWSFWFFLSDHSRFFFVVIILAYNRCFSSFLHIMHRCQIEIKIWPLYVNVYIFTRVVIKRIVINRLSLLIISQIERQRTYIEIWRRHSFRFVPDHHESKGRIKKIDWKLKETFCYESNSYCDEDQTKR